MRISYTPDTETLLKDIDFASWRFVHCKEEMHREQIRKAYNRRPRLRKTTRH